MRERQIKIHKYQKKLRMKRPIVWFGSAYVFGEVLGLSGHPAAAVLGAAAACVIVIFGMCTGKTVQRHPVTRVCFAVLPFFIAAGAWRAACAAQDAAAAVRAYETFPENVRVSGTVVRIEEKAKVNYVYITVTESSEQRLLGRQFLLAADKETPAGFGDAVTAYGGPILFEAASNPGVYDAREAFAVMGVYYQMFPEQMTVKPSDGYALQKMMLRFKERLKSVYERVLSQTDAGIICGMVLGEKQTMDMQLKELYQRQGIAHIFAISGLHMSMAGMGLFKLLRRLKAGLIPAFLTAAAGVGAYGWICGMGDSAVRALVMMILSMGAQTAGRTYDSQSGLFLAAWIILWRKPLALTSFGFVMSFASVWALVSVCPVFYPKDDGSRTSKICRRCADGLLPGLCISVVTVPAVCWFLYEYPLYGPLINLMILPLMSILFPAALIGGLAGMVWLPAGKFLMGIVHLLLKLYELICRCFDCFPAAQVITGRPLVSQLLIAGLLFGLLTAAVLKYKPRHGWVWLAGLLAAEYLLLALPKPVDGLRIVFADVGQGDCAVVSTEDGTHFMIDAGSSSKASSGKYITEKILKYYGIRSLDMVFASHMDDDHINGIEELIERGYDIGQLFVPSVIPSLEKGGALLHQAAAHGITAGVFDAGMAVYANDGKNIRWSLQCLHPASDFETSSDNEASMMLLLQYEEIGILFTGDAETAAETAVLEKIGPVQVLKAGHHGAKNSTSTALLEKIRPKAAIISCGKDNRYGHPHEETLGRLEASGCPYFVTAKSGAAVLRYSRGTLRIIPWLGG